jgi:hypothetical protein
MKYAQPRDLSKRRVTQLLAEAKSSRSTTSRIEVFSRHFLGRQYMPNPLIGSAEQPEVFTASLDGLDCVTYVEMVLALSRSSSVDDFVKLLRNIRYENGRVAWDRRNHYMTGWIRSNTRAGFVRRIAPARVPAVAKVRTLDGLEGLPPVRVRFECVPKPSVPMLVRYMKTGDLIFFASTRKHHDVFHCGIIVREGDRALLRHASRSRSIVVQQELDEFLKANRMAGVIAVRPVEQRS